MEVTIGYSTDENYVNYLCVSIASLVAHISMENTYRIFVLTSDLADTQKELIRSAGKGKENVTFEFIEPEKVLAQNLDNLSSKAHYYRFALIDLFPDLDKILYLDCDTVIMADVAELFKTDLTGYYFAAVRDCITFETNDCHSDWLRYCKDELGIKNPLQYINSGVLLMNLPELRKDYNFKKLAEMSGSRKYRDYDQGVFNQIGQGRIYFLPFRWNFYSCVNGDDIILKKDRREYENAQKNLAVIHYISGEKPWKKIDVQYSSFFWKYVPESGVAEGIWQEACKNNNCQIGELLFNINDPWKNEMRMVNAIYDGKVGFKSYLRLVKAMIVGTFRKIKRKFAKL